MNIDKDIENIILLLDDPDEYVEETMTLTLLDIGEDVMEPLMYHLNKEKNTTKKAAIRKKIIILNREFILDELFSFATTEEPDLKYGIYLLCKIFNYRLSLYDFNTTIFALAEDMAGEITDEKTALEKVGLFNDIFYRRLNFRCCDTYMSSEKNSQIIQVIENRFGNPIAISIIYFLLARCIGLPVVPLCFKSGFVPVYLDGNRSLFYINIFKDGDIFSEEKLQSFFASQGIEYKKDNFKLGNDKSLMIIYLESLMFLYTSKGNDEITNLLSRALSIFGNERFLLND